MPTASIGAVRPDLARLGGSPAATRRGARHRPLRSTWRAMAGRSARGFRPAGSSSKSTCVQRGSAAGRGNGRVFAFGFGRVRQHPPGPRSATDCMGCRPHAKAKLPVLRWALCPNNGDNPDQNRKGEIEMLMILLVLAAIVLASSRISSLTLEEGTRGRRKEGFTYRPTAPVPPVLRHGTARNCFCPSLAEASAIWRIAWLGAGMASSGHARGTEPIGRRKTQPLLGDPTANRIRAISKRRSYRSGSGNKAWLDGWGKPRPHPSATVARPFGYPIGMA